MESLKHWAIKLGTTEAYLRLLLGGSNDDACLLRLREEIEGLEDTFDSVQDVEGDGELLDDEGDINWDNLYCRNFFLYCITNGYEYRTFGKFSNRETYNSIMSRA